MSKSDGFLRIAHAMGRPSGLVAIAVNVVFFYFAYGWVSEHIDAARLLDRLSHISPSALSASIGINVVALILYGARMALLMRVPIATGFSVVNIGYAANALVPMRLGEPVKLYLARQLYAQPLLKSFSASVAEKVLDILKLLLIGLGAVTFATAPVLDKHLFLLGAVFLAAFSGAVFLVRNNFGKIVRWLPKGWKIRRTALELYKHTSEYPLVQVLLISVVIWILNLTLIYVSFNTYVPELSITFLDATVLLLIIALAIAIPSAPAGIGIFEAGVVAYLSQISRIEYELALAVAVAFHLTVTVPQFLITGAIILHRISKRTPRCG